MVSETKPNAAEAVAGLPQVSPAELRFGGSLPNRMALGDGLAFIDIYVNNLLQSLIY